MITIIFYHHAKAQRGIRLISLKHSMIIDEKSVHDEANVQTFIRYRCRENFFLMFEECLCLTNLCQNFITIGHLNQKLEGGSNPPTNPPEELIYFTCETNRPSAGDRPQTPH